MLPDNLRQGVAISVNTSLFRRVLLFQKVPCPRPAPRPPFSTAPRLAAVRRLGAVTVPPPFARAQCLNHRDAGRAGPEKLNATSPTVTRKPSPLKFGNTLLQRKYITA